MNTEQKTNQILKKNNLRPNKRFGQNFLIDDDILQGIVEASNLTSEDIVIEIGPGLGNLTEYLLKKAKKVIAFEIDKNMVEVLNERFEANSNFDLIYNDILKVNIDDYIYAVIANMGQFKGKIKVIANLPYYITTPIIFALFEKTKCISDITIMIQKEVAKRIVADPGNKDYGVLSVMVQYYSRPKIELEVAPECFIPAPNVSSSVVYMERKDKDDTVDSEKLQLLVKSAFSQRRKKMINSLLSQKELNLSKEKILSMYEELNLNENVRAEEVSLENFIKMAKKI